MSTAFTERRFTYCECANGTLNVDGTYTEGAVSVRTVAGTVQPMSFKECLAFSDGSRNTGFVKVYSNEKLESRTRGGNAGGFVALGGEIFRLTAEQAYQNAVMAHWKYIGNMVPESEIPEAVRAALLEAA